MKRYLHSKWIHTVLNPALAPGSGIRNESTPNRDWTLFETILNPYFVFGNPKWIPPNRGWTVFETTMKRYLHSKWIHTVLNPALAPGSGIRNESTPNRDWTLFETILNPYFVFGNPKWIPPNRGWTVFETTMKRYLHSKWIHTVLNPALAPGSGIRNESTPNRDWTLFETTLKPYFVFGNPKWIPPNRGWTVFETTMKRYLHSKWIHTVLNVALAPGSEIRNESTSNRDWTLFETTLKPYFVFGNPKWIPPNRGWTVFETTMKRYLHSKWIHTVLNVALAPGSEIRNESTPNRDWTLFETTLKPYFVFGNPKWIPPNRGWTVFETTMKRYLHSKWIHTVLNVALAPGSEIRNESTSNRDWTLFETTLKPYFVFGNPKWIPPNRGWTVFETTMKRYLHSKWIHTVLNPALAPGSEIRNESTSNRDWTLFETTLKPYFVFGNPKWIPLIEVELYLKPQWNDICIQSGFTQY